MRLSSFRLSILATMVLVATTAPVILLVGMIERGESEGIVHRLRSAAESKQLDATLEASFGDTAAASKSRREAAAAWALWREEVAHPDRLRISLSPLSGFVLMIYGWGVVHCLVLRAEAMDPPPDPFDWPVGFRVWSAGHCGFLFAFFAAAVLFHRQRPAGASVMHVPDLLFWLHGLYILGGITYFRGLRVPAMILGLPMGLITVFLAVNSHNW